MTYDEIKAAWNVQADEHNQWDELSEAEKIEWAASIAAAKERAARLDAQEEVVALKERIARAGVEQRRAVSEAALEEAEAALEVATSRLAARSANYPVHVTSEARALEIVRKALGKSHADHFRDATKMMLPTAPDPQGLDAQVQDRLDRLYLALEVCSAELFAQCADQGRAMKYVEQARSALAAEQCARAAQAVCGGAAS